MSEDTRLATVLSEWASIFMHRSMQEFTLLMQETGLSMAQLSTLMRLHYGGACGVSHIGDKLGVTTAAASKMIDRLVQQGLVQREEDPDDRRVKNVTVSTAGVEIVQQAVAARQAWLADLTRLVDPAEQAVIIDALQKLTAAGRQLSEHAQAD
ncbi:MAG: MarR family transcriptional regulator [Anaerolineales bacterium]|nr:MarR family transcriptional regulator [Anaerolineales bacterium]MCB8950453.1 MarR family transcriptional regulator [Ardenticatenales bacterium]